MRIALIGSSGEIGQLIQKSILLEKKYDYIRFGRTEDRLGSSRGIPFKKFDFLKDELFLGKEFNYIIYCAYDFSDLRNSELNVNYNSIKKINFNQDSKIIYISSVLAENPLSVYGQVKLLNEKLVSKLNGISVRLGVVESFPPISNIKTLSELAKKFRFLVFPGLNSEVLVSNEKTISKSIIDVIENNDKTNASVIYAVTYISTLKECVRKTTGTEIKLVNFPLWVLAPLFYLSKKIKPLLFFGDKFENLKISPLEYSSWIKEKSN
jgi:dTDP-4-dehydrorhamnose reductase